MLFPDNFEHLQELSELVARRLQRQWRKGIVTVKRLRQRGPATGSTSGREQQRGTSSPTSAA